MRLDTPVRFIKGVGPERAKVFAELGVHTVQDLLEHFPFRWEFCPEISKIGDLKRELEQLQAGQES